MDNPNSERQTSAIEPVRQNSAGERLTASQSDEVGHIVAIMKRSIEKKGAFKDKLGDFAHAFARSEKFDALKGETIIRDQFKARYGQTMNAMREDLQSREANLNQTEKSMGLSAALNVGTKIANGETMPFYRAYDEEAVSLSKSLNITETGAKMLMKEEYRTHNGGELYSDCKAIEQQYHTPKLEAEKQQVKAARTRNVTQAR
jgi:hypothetical protein